MRRLRVLRSGLTYQLAVDGEARDLESEAAVSTLVGSGQSSVGRQGSV